MDTPKKEKANESQTRRYRESPLRGPELQALDLFGRRTAMGPIFSLRVEPEILKKDTWRSKIEALVHPKCWGNPIFQEPPSQEDVGVWQMRYFWAESPLGPDDIETMGLTWGIWQPAGILPAISVCANPRFLEGIDPGAWIEAIGVSPSVTLAGSKTPARLTIRPCGERVHVLDLLSDSPTAIGYANFNALLLASKVPRSS